MRVKNKSRSKPQWLGSKSFHLIGEMNIVTLDKDGRHAAFSNRRNRTYVYMTEGMDEPEELPRVLVPA